MNAIPAPHDENYQAEPPIGSVNEPQPPKETDAQRAYRLLAEYTPNQADQYDDDDYDYDDEPDYDYLDDEPSNDYSIGYQDGYNAGLYRNSLRYRLYILIPYRVRMKYYAIRRRLFPHNNDIPF